MKLHIPLPLRAALLAACAVVSLSTLSGAAVFENLENGATDAFRKQFPDGPPYTITEDLYFRNNHVTGYFATGGALAPGFGDEVVFRDCGEIEFTGNYARSTNTESWDDPDEADVYDTQSARGGAIYVSGGSGLVFDGNDKVVLRGNYVVEQRLGELRYVLNAIYVLPGSPDVNCGSEIKVKEGQVFECYDSVACDGAILYINGDKDHQGPAKDNANRYNGRVTFSGKYTEEDLKKITGVQPTAEQLEASRRVYVGAVQVCDGTLALEDGIILDADRGYWFPEMSAGVEVPQYSVKIEESAKLEMKDAVIRTQKPLTAKDVEHLPGGGMGWSEDDIAAGEVYISNASFSGANTIYAHTLESTGGTWTFNVGKENLKTPIVSLKFHLPKIDDYNDILGPGTFTSREGTVFDIEWDGTLAAGKYKLLEFDRTDGTWEREAGMPKITGKASSETVGDRAGSGDVYLSTNGNTITLIYDTKGGAAAPEPAHRQPTTLTWGNGNGTWADSAGNGDGHWSGSVEDKNFYTGDSVVFSSEAEVNISGTVRPKDILVNNASGTVRFVGSGQITDADIPSSQAKLTKEGAGTLEIDTDNAYTGGTELKAGKIVVGNTGAPGLGVVTVSGGTLDMGSKALTNELHVAGTATVENGGSYAGRLVLDSGTLNGALNLAQDAELKDGTVAGVLNGRGGVAVNGNVTLSAANTYTGKTTVQSGGNLHVTGSIAGKQFDVQNGGTYSGSLAGSGLDVTLSGGTIAGDVTLGTGSTLSVTAKDSSVQGKLSVAQGGRLRMPNALADRYAHGLTIMDLLFGIPDLTDVQTDASLTVSELVADGGELAYDPTKLDALNVDTFTTTTNKTLLDIGNGVLTWESGEHTLLNYKGLGDGSDAKSLAIKALEGLHTRQEFNLELKPTSLALTIVGEKANLTWQGSTEVWTTQESGHEWKPEGDVPDHNFYDLDGVKFVDADDVKIKGNVTPGSIEVEVGDGKTTTFTNVDEKTLGHVRGTAPLTKTGKGTLAIETDNFDYTGNITVKEGTLKAGHANAFGSGSVAVNGATLDANNLNIAARVTMNGQSVLENASGVKQLAFNSGASVSSTTGYTLASGNILAIGSGGSAYTGDFTFGGGTLALTGGVFDLTGATSISASGDPSLLDLSAWEGLVYGKTYTPVSGTFDADLASALKLSALSDPDMLGKAHIEVRDGEIVLVIDRLDGTSHIGAELATAISSQTEGNMAHLRRLRGAIGSGQTISSKNRIGAYITGYAENNRLDQDAQGRGYHRTEIGGTLGLETAFKDERVVLGIALSAGRANISPSGSAPRYHEDITREDLYLVTKYKRLRSTTSVGIGQHDFNLQRALGNGTIARAKDVSGNSVNLGEEIAVILSATEKQSYETFFAVESSYNHIDSFREGGNQSLSVDSHDAWATDLSLGLRANFLFPVVSSAPSAVFSVQGAVITSVGDTVTDVTMRYAGAPDQPYSLRSAKRNRWGYSVGASLSVPVTPNAAIISSSECILRGDSHEVTATLGAKLAF